jgi:1-phosphatidylinositol-4-phosphate 5-kinase
MPDANNRQLHFVVMRSVFHTTKKISRVWDLKGSKANRKSEPGESVGKDLDILEEGRKLRFVDPCARSAFIDQIRRDATFLARLGIMDYSLLLGLHNCEEESDEDDGGNADPSTPPGRKKEVEELSGSNTPLRRGIIQRASSVGLFKKGNTATPPALHRGLTDITRTSKSPVALNIIPESPPSSSVAAAMSVRKKSAITSRIDSGIEGYGGLLADGTISMNKEIYFCGIIDFLQYYNAMKKGETVVKKAQGHSGEDISCVDPETYGNRFVKFISNLIEKAE